MAKNDTPKNIRCSFCGKTQENVKKIVAGPGVYICDECVDLCTSIIEAESFSDEDIGYTLSEEIPSPREIKKTLDDYVIMSMVECGFGVSILPELILNRTTYNIKAMELDKPEYRNIVLALKSVKSASPTVKRFIEHIKYRHNKK